MHAEEKACAATHRRRPQTSAGIKTEPMDARENRGGGRGEG